MNILRFLREQAKDYDCSKCGANHAGSEIRVLGKLDAAWVVRVTCAKCRDQLRLLVVVETKDGERILKRDHPSAVRRRPAIGSDEVLDAHELLRAYDGGIDALFGVREKGAGSTAR